MMSDDLYICRRMVHVPEHDEGTAYEYFERVAPLPASLRPVLEALEKLYGWTKFDEKLSDASKEDAKTAIQTLKDMGV